ncbi:MAG: type 2 isopentenyl-diphosphate Delta-isomerase [Candidatus Micrarchaeota archaeon]
MNPTKQNEKNPKANKQTESRKKDHVDIVLKKDVQYTQTNGLEKVQFIHNALPECDFNKIDLSTNFLNKKLQAPILITGMTGGYKDAQWINQELAKAAQKYGLAFGLGSQRAMIENPELKKTYDVRSIAPSVPIIANIGAVQLKKYSTGQIEEMIDAVDADALAIHLNALQEVIQPEGDKDFSGVLSAIEKACEVLETPIIVKETGAGISDDVAIKLKEIGVAYIDVSGSGGTSWSKVEYQRGKTVPGFENWGNSTFDSLLMCKGILPLIASGGIRSGIDIAKSITLGADLGGSAYPLIKALHEKKLEEKIEEWTNQIRTCMFLTGSKDIESLKKAKMMIRS